MTRKSNTPMIGVLALASALAASVFTACGRKSEEAAIAASSEESRGTAAKADYDRIAAEARTALDNHQYSRAADLLREGAENGHVESMALLGLSYLMLDWDLEGVAWVRKAAEAGHGFAQYNLTRCYGRGIGVPKNYSEADYWEKKARENGVSVSKVYVDYAPFKY